MGLRPLIGDEALTSAARAAGTYTSGPIAAPGTATAVVLGIHVTAVSGSPTLNCSIEESADGTSWSAVTGSSTAQLTAAGNAMAFAAVTKNYVRVTSTVAGTTPSVTYRAMVLVLPS